jgi:hypothetical protein
MTDHGLIGIMLSLAESDDDLEGVGWSTVDCCPN